MGRLTRMQTLPTYVPIYLITESWQGFLIAN